jgi:outer membrane autotransporter protein
VWQGSVDSLTGRAGAVLGTKLLDGAGTFMGDLYVKAGVLHEFMGTQHMILNGTEDFRIDGLKTRWYYGFGGERYIARAGDASMKIYGQLERTEGDRYTGEYEARLGFKVTW